MNTFLDYIFTSLAATASQLLMIFVPGLLLAFAMNFISGMVESGATSLFGMNLYLALFGWLGTTVHESGHALFCLIFGHKIKEIKFFSPDPDRGSLGYVNHSYNPKNIYHTAGNFFIGIGPILLGSLVIFILSLILLDIDLKVYSGDFSLSSNTDVKDLFRMISQLVRSLYVVVKSTFFNSKNLTDWKFYLFIYLAFSIGSSIKLSLPDIRGAFKGFTVILVVMLIFNFATAWMGSEMMESFYTMIGPLFGIFYSILILTLILNAIAALILHFIPI